jgi:peptidoglycan hydrolase-like protein with peptidoglycan-binding domain
MQMKYIAIAIALALAGPALAGGDKGQAASSESTSMSQQQAGQHDAETIKQVQQALKDKGHEPGPIDGIAGPRTQAALKDFQKAQGSEATGQLDDQTLSALGVSGAGPSMGATTPPAGDTSAAGSAPTTTSSAPADTTGTAPSPTTSAPGEPAKSTEAPTGSPATNPAAPAPGSSTSEPAK